MYETKTFDELGQLYSAEMTDRLRNGESVAIEMDVAMAASMLALLQLALRHPEMRTGAVATHARLVSILLQQQLSRTPAIAESCRRGWLRQFDEASHAQTN